MKAVFVASGRTRVEIALWRHGWAWPLAALIGGFVLTVHAVVVESASADLEEVRTAIAKELKRQAMPAPVTQDKEPRQAEQRLQAARARLTPFSEADALVRRMAALARTEQIALTQSEYQHQVNAGIGVTRVQISQPVRASYPQLRRYIEAVLQAIPNASLDQVIATRENVGQTQVEARLKWSLWTSTTAQRPVNSVAAAPKEPAQ